jgi:hypothetical protein
MVAVVSDRAPTVIPLISGALQSICAIATVSAGKPEPSLESM